MKHRGRKVKYEVEINREEKRLIEGKREGGRKGEREEIITETKHRYEVRKWPSDFVNKSKCS